MNRSPLVPCPSCDRHVRSDTAACPFCAAALPAPPVAAVPGLARGQRLGRAATFAFGATLGLAACDGGGTHALYGGPGDAFGYDAHPETSTGSDVQNDDATAADASTDDGSDGGIVAAYGGPPSDGG